MTSPVTSPAASPLLVESADDRMVVTLNRPEVRNAIDLSTVEALHEVCAELETSPRPLILTGAGGTFAAGADIRQLRERGRDQALAGINRRVFDRIAALPLPTIAAVDGPALGGGAELAYACDIRIASPTARFGNPEPGLGIIASAGAGYRLSELIGRSMAKAVLLAGHLLDADAALRCGLVLEVVPADELLALAHKLAGRINRQSALALRLAKLGVDAPQSHPLVDDFAQAILFETDDKRDRMTAFLEKK
jgi:enoyl-CoA hydratase